MASTQPPLFGDPRVQPSDEGGWRVASSSHPGTWHDVTEEGACDCLGYAHRGNCRHLRLLRELGYLPAPEPPALPPVRTGIPTPGDGRTIWTARYANKRLGTLDVVPVQTSLGRPKFPLPYGIADSLPSVTPERWMLGKDYDEYRQAYRDKLARAGVEAILSEIQAIVERHAGRPVALLCFEPIHEPGRWCHRMILADWLAERAGIEVLEVAEAD